MKKSVLALTTISAISIISAVAFADPIADRQAIMKGNGKALGTLAPIVKGEKPFDAALVLDTLTALNENVQKIDVAVLWPEGSDEGDTRSLPKIWANMADFKARAEKLKTDVAAAVAAAPKDNEALQVQFKAVASNCGGCHELYQRPKQ